MILIERGRKKDVAILPERNRDDVEDEINEKREINENGLKKSMLRDVHMWHSL